MKLSFWTLGMPSWPIAEIAAQASVLAYDGVDLRCTGTETGRLSSQGNLSLEASREELVGIARIFRESNLDLPCLLCYNQNRFDVASVNWDSVQAELTSYARIADQLGCAQIRIQVARPQKGTKWDWEEYLDNLGAVSLAAVKDTPGVNGVFENHVGSANAEQLLRMVAKRGDSRLGVILSPDHCVVMQEDPVALTKHFSAAIQQVCLADRRVVKEDLGSFDGRYYYVRYETCLMGEGVVPTARILETLASRGYDGYVSLKWEKSDSFGHHLPSGEVALRHFTEYMRGLGYVSREQVDAGDTQ